MPVETLLTTIPPLAVYLSVAVIIGMESLGIPMPGEIALVTAAFLATRDALDINPVAVAAAGITGAIVGDSIGYALGRRFGMTLFEKMGRRFPKHFGTGHVALAKQLFTRWGGWAVFFGRFIALLRILAGPLAGTLRMRYRYFLAANAAGAVCWAGGTTAVVYFLGVAAEKWMARFSWVALVVAVVISAVLTLLLKRRTAALIAQLESEHDWESLRGAH
ncbi:MAG: DedA family protein [Mycobacterium sp.]|nr:MAG: DedA family protein [Mycobacterium sp.]